MSLSHQRQRQRAFGGSGGPSASLSWRGALEKEVVGEGNGGGVGGLDAVVMGFWWCVVAEVARD